jgi:phage/plasmid-associated DNA primase
VFFHRIERDFPKRIKEDVDWVKHILFDNLFDNLELSRYIQAMIARSIYGDYRVRKSIFCRGETASGKGMITEALTKTFPGLVNSFDANNLIFSKSTKDEAQKNMWLISFKTSRLLISNEMSIEVGDDGKMKKFFDSNAFKKIVSGGDEIEVRGMNENIRKMVNRANLFFMAQDFPEFMPKCTAVNDRKEDVLFPKSFVLSPKHPNQFKRDTTIKDKFKMEQYQDALIYVIIESYQKDVKGKEYFGPTHTEEFEEVIKESEEAETLQSVLEQKYIFVSDDEFDPLTSDKFVHSDELNAYITAKLGYSDKRLGLEFRKLGKQLGYKFESKVDNAKKKRYRTNIIKKPLI